MLTINLSARFNPVTVALHELLPYEWVIGYRFTGSRSSSSRAQKLRSLDLMLIMTHADSLEVTEILDGRNGWSISSIFY